MENSTITINQKSKCEIKITAFSVDWLVNNTMVNIFNPNSPGKFEGYQRKIDTVHRARIITYIEENDFYFSSSIICSIPKGSREKQILQEENKKMFIVDGQHRVDAFREIKNTNIELYNKIKDFTVPVTILNEVDLNTEIDTFITINKTGKKVDTSLAYILKNQINDVYKQKDTAKIDYIIVETAKKLCDEEESIGNIWYDKISFEGNPKTNNCFISLNAFILSERKYIRNLIKYNLLSLDDLEYTKKNYFQLFNEKWDLIKSKWNDLFLEDNTRTIIQGPIGVSSLNRYFVTELQREIPVNDITSFIEDCLTRIHPTIKSELWHKGELFSLYSSEAGYKKVSELLKDGITEIQNN